MSNESFSHAIYDEQRYIADRELDWGERTGGR